MKKLPVQTNLSETEVEVLRVIADREDTSIAAIIRRMVRRDPEFLSELSVQQARQQGIQA